MFTNFFSGLTAMSAALAPTADTAPSSVSYHLRATVPVYCSVDHQNMGSAASSDGVVSLGTFREYCNAPTGYRLIVKYTPGSLLGAKMLAGSDTAVLDGSGEVTLSTAIGPRVRKRMISIVPGENGFDTDRLEIDIVPN